MRLTEGLAIGAAVLPALMIGARGCGSEPARCEPSGTFAESGGVRIRVHGANLCPAVEASSDD